MELTGKCKLEFEKWLLIWLKDNVAWDVENPQQEDVDHFYTFPLAMQYGVYVDFFEERGMSVDLLMLSYHKVCPGVFTKDVARKLAIEETRITFNKEFDGTNPHH